jgi:hypothetical protein
MQRVSPANGEMTPVRTDSIPLDGDILWAQDGSGALIVNITAHE